MKPGFEAHSPVRAHCAHAASVNGGTQVDGHIDQIGQLLLLRQTSADAKKYAAAEKWATQLAALQNTILTKLA